MELSDFIRHYLQYARIPVTDIPTQTPSEFAVAFENDPQCRNWYIRQRLKDLHIDAGRFCCLELALWNLEDLTQRVQKDEKPSPKKFVIYWEEFRAFGIQHPSQKFCVPISHCPWCGQQLSQFDYYTQYPRDAEP